MKNALYKKQAYKSDYFSYAQPKTSDLMKELVDDLFKPQPLHADVFPDFDVMKFPDEPDVYEVHLAVAGFTQDMLEVFIEDSMLTIKGSKAEEEDSDNEEEEPAIVYIHNGIKKGAFVKRINMDWSIIPEGECCLEDGILKIKVRKYVPDYKKKQNVPIYA